jgi:hypothetical protein
MKSGKAAARAAAAGQKASRSIPSQSRFNETVMAAARSVPADRRFGDNKVFISDAFDAYKKTPEGRAMDLDTFKDMLVKGVRARAFDLARADMVEAMSTEKVARSAIYSPGDSGFFRNALYNFVVLDPPRRR